MKSYEIINELKCWQGYHRVKGRPAGSPGSCAKNTNEQQTEPTQQAQQEEPKQKSDSPMRGLIDLITTVGSKRLAIAGVGQTQQATQPVPASPNPVSQLKPEDDLEEQDAQQEPKPEPKQNSDSPMRGLLNLITTVGRAATSMQGRDLGADLKQDVKTMIRNKVTGEPNR